MSGTALTSVRVAHLRPGMFLKATDLGPAEEPFSIGDGVYLDEELIEQLRATAAERVKIDVPATKARLAAEPGKGNGDARLGAHRAMEVDRGAIPAPVSDIVRKSRAVVTEMLESARAGQAIDPEGVHEVVEGLETAISENASAALAMGRIRDLEHYSYQHSVNVGVLLMTFARHLEMDSRTVRRLGAAGLFHDIGKSQVPVAILTKPGKLTEEEYREIKRHPLAGVEILQESYGLDEEIFEITEHHHEKINGKGYPHGLSGSRLTKISRMAAITDVYDAITAERPYAGGKPPTMGLDVLRKESESVFDKSLVGEFIRAIGIYPPGSLVRLDDGHLGVVVEHDPARPTTPKVLVIYNEARGEPLPEPVDRDLSSKTELRILAAVDPELYGLRPSDYLST